MTNISRLSALLVLLSAALLPAVAEADWPPTRWGMSKSDFLKIYPTATMGDEMAFVEPPAGADEYCDDRKSVSCIGTIFGFDDAGTLKSVDVTCHERWAQCLDEFKKRYPDASFDEKGGCPDQGWCLKIEYYVDKKNHNRIRLMDTVSGDIESVDMRFSAEGSEL